MYGDAVINISEVARLGELAPALSGMMERIERALTRLDSARVPSTEAFSDPWLTADQARKYLGGMSKGTFDKYRNDTTPRLSGHRLDGKFLYKRSDLDNFVRLYELKSGGAA